MPVEATFSCSACEREAGRVALEESPDAPRLVRRGARADATFFQIPAVALNAIQTALAASDAQALYIVNPEYAPFFCPNCKSSYCAHHWEMRDVFDEDHPSWYDSTIGKCPHGHEKRVEE